MSKRSAFQHYPLGKTKRLQAVTDRFLGVDYSSQKFLVANGRAIDLKNFIFTGNRVEKRHGYEQLFLVDDFEYVPADFDNPSTALLNEVHTNAKNINNIWAFEGEDSKVHIIAHIGKLLYEVKNIDNDDISVEPILASSDLAQVDNLPYYLAFEYENYKSQAFVGGKKLWFLGGNKYMCIRYRTSQVEVFAVENSDKTPIPVTTISITSNGSTVSQRMSLDKTNLMTEWRINKLITGTTRNEEKKTQKTFYEYNLDAPLIPKTARDMADITVVIEERGKTR